MRSVSPAWGALLRMGRRQVRRNRLRSLLIVALIAIPVAAVSLVDVLVRSNPLSPAQRVESVLGGADAQVRWYGAGPIEQSPDGDNFNQDANAAAGGAAATGSANSGAPASGSANSGVPASGSAGGGAAPAIKPPTTGQVQAWLPGPGIISPDRSRPVLIKTEAGAISTSLSALDLTVAGTRPAVSLVAGDWSAAAGGVALSDDLARRAGLAVGDTLTLRRPRAELKVVAITHAKYGGTGSATVSPAVFTALPGATQDNQESLSWTVSRPGGVSWADVVRLNQHGLQVMSRQVLLDPPPRSEVPYYRQGGGAQPGASTMVTVAVAVGMAILQLALLAGPAFAVSARRRRHDMALIAAIGGNRKVLRRTMLAESIVLGVLASGLGCTVGIGAAIGYRAVQPGVLGPLRLHWLELAGTMALGLLSAVAGALLPAVSAARLDVVAALAGRRGATRAPWRLSAVGMGAVVLGFVAGGFGTSQSQVLYIPARAGAVRARRGRPDPGHAEPHRTPGAPATGGFPDRAA
ncbi:ABC transporter permease [Jatrophihabitans lederbergiae]|uniref:FtsX-like permease family protein n=1 Tax=Jatrophihabitans lederbergiae TaxID=3075547 RepID=A0ABU2J4A7_9ACTN|nr:FtsX-like permease family protein [Jatrophihabitans sp. DSM 44399]MDT0259815.1 FtsX-like permease family protein [Jatrophihabitans sp. DSM 44399]